MSESPYAISTEELFRRTWIPVSEQVVEQPVLSAPPADWDCGVALGDGGDADGD